jgi:glycosyltransferase involved in cell wall biosynthesis
VNFLSSLTKEGHDVALWVMGHGEAHPEHHELVKRSVLRAQTFNNQAPSLRLWHQHDMSLHAGKGVHAGYTIFELDWLTPVEIHQVNSLDKVMVPSSWAADILHDVGIPKEKINVVPLGVDTSIFKHMPEIRNTNEHTQDTTVFMNIGKWEIRKGHDILLEAFNKAFTQEDKVHLVLNCFNPFLFDQQSNKDGNLDWFNLYNQSPLKDKIFIIDKRLPTQTEVMRLMNEADCGVFPARAEGWNLELLEMMACGKHVITTNYSGHTDYANGKNSFLIDTEDKLEDAFDGTPFFKGQGKWAALGEAQINQLAVHMREVHRRRQQEGHAAFINTKGIETAKAFSWKRTAKAIAEVLA